MILSVPNEMQNMFLDRRLELKYILTKVKDRGLVAQLRGP